MNWLSVAGPMLLITVAATAVADPVAFVVAMKGKVSVTPSGTSTPVRAALGRPLERGDRVQVGAASTASIFFGDGNLIELGEQSTVTVGGKVSSGSANRLGPGSDASRDVFLKVSRFIRGDSKQSGMVALAPMRGDATAASPVILSPRRTVIRADRPEFRWREVPGAVRYRLVVRSDADDELLSVETTGTTLAYPDDRPPLAAGAEYLMELSAQGESGRIRGEETVFSILTPPEARQIDDHLTRIERASRDGSPQAAHYLVGSYLMGQGLYGEAIPHFETLCRLEPEAPGPHEALSSAYRTVGLIDLADAESGKAAELSKAVR